MEGVRRVRLITNDDYRDLIRFIEGIEMALKNNHVDLALSGLDFMKGNLLMKIEEE
jgi:hypothetical protein